MKLDTNLLEYTFEYLKLFPPTSTWVGAAVLYENDIIVCEYYITFHCKSLQQYVV